MLACSRSEGPPSALPSASALFHTGKVALSFGWPADAVDYFRQVAEINPSHAPTQAFLSRLAEAGVDVDAWQAGEDVDGDGDDAGSAAVVVEPPPLLELPDGLSDDIKLG